MSTLRWTPEQKEAYDKRLGRLVEMHPAENKRKAKYGNQKTLVDGHLFDSKRESERYQELKLLEKAGLIRDLKCQPEYICEVNGIVVCKYLGDFEYWNIPNRRLVTEDVKTEGTKTAVYRLKKKLVRAVLGIEIEEV